MKNGAILILMLIFASMAYAENETDIPDTTVEGITGLRNVTVKYVNTFEENYTKPKEQNETVNVSVQSTTNTTSQTNTSTKPTTAEEYDKQFKERYKVLISK